MGRRGRYWGSRLGELLAWNRLGEPPGLSSTLGSRSLGPSGASSLSLHSSFSPWDLHTQDTLSHGSQKIGKMWVCETSGSRLHSKNQGQGTSEPRNQHFCIATSTGGTWVTMTETKGSLLNCKRGVMTSLSPWSPQHNRKRLREPWECGTALETYLPWSRPVLMLQA